jgi:pyruvate/2-oxoacid:ferredoxin oxidoreductase beta subunit
MLRVQDIKGLTKGAKIRFYHIKKIVRQKPKTPEEAFDMLLARTIEKLRIFKNEKYSKRITHLTEHKEEYIQVFKEVMATWKEYEKRVDKIT